MTQRRLGWCFRWVLSALVSAAAAVVCLVLVAPVRQPPTSSSSPSMSDVVGEVSGHPEASLHDGVLRSFPSVPSGGVFVTQFVINGYTVTVWDPPQGRIWEFGHSLVQITSPSGETRAIDWVNQILPVSGTDITGSGNPDLVVERDSGGAGCCFSCAALDLGTGLTTITLPFATPCGASFRDLDGDGIFEMIACDDSFRCWFCSCASSPLPTVVLRYDLEQGYIPASPDFPEIYDPDIPGYRARAESRSGEVFEEQDPTGRCFVLPLVLAYLYSGRASAAWAALARYYPFPDAEAFRAEIEEVVLKSRLFAAAPGVGEMVADMRESPVASDATAEQSVGKPTFSVAVDLNGDGAEETIVGIGARTADKVAEFIAPGEVYVYANPETPLPVFACRSSLPADLLSYFFQASLVGTGDLDGDGLTEIALVWLGQYSWPLAYRPLAILQFDPSTSTYEMVTDVKRSVGEIGDYALADVDDDGRAEILEVDPVYGKVIDPTYGAEVSECHFCPHRYQVGVFEFTGTSFVSDSRVNGGQPFQTDAKYEPYLGEGPVTSFLPELIDMARSLAQSCSVAAFGTPDP